MTLIRPHGLVLGIRRQAGLPPRSCFATEQAGTRGSVMIWCTPDDCGRGWDVKAISHSRQVD